MTGGRFVMVAVLASVLSGCAVEKIADGGPFITRDIKVKGRDVATFTQARDIPGRYEVIDEVYIRDDGATDPDELERNLREMAGAKGANGLILASTNRTPNGTRIDLKVRLDNPYDHFAGTAVWIGDGPRPVKVIRP